MGWSQAFHGPVLADVMTFTSEGVPMVSLTFRDADLQECRIITPHITAAIAAADAFNAEVSRSRAVRECEA
jgi:PKD repeat protein